MVPEKARDRRSAATGPQQQPRDRILPNECDIYSLCRWGAFVDRAGKHRWTEADEKEFSALIARCEARGMAA